MHSMFRNIQRACCCSRLCRDIHTLKCWLLIGALMLTALANAQRLKCLPACQPIQLLSANVCTDSNEGLTPAQETTPKSPETPSHSPSVPWTFSLITSGYIVPGGPSYVSPDFTADRKWAHFEARYNNEALQTGSLWAGYNINAGKKVVILLTPLVGGVFGNLNGVAPGYLLTITYKRLQGYSSGELVFNLQDRGRSYFYNWNQLTYSPLKWLQVGAVSQRTRVYDTGLGIQRGVLVGFTHKKVNFTANIFNFGWTTPTEVLALDINF